MGGKTTLAGLDKEIAVLKTGLYGVDGKNGLRGSLVTLDEYTKRHVKTFFVRLEALEKEVALMQSTVEEMHSTLHDGFKGVVKEALAEALAAKPKQTPKDVVIELLKKSALGLAVLFVVGVFVLVAIGSLSAEDIVSIIGAVRGGS